MHRLDLEDPRLALPVPIYALAGRPERFADKRGLRPADGDPPVAFYAYDRPAPGTLPVWWSGAACGRRELVAGGEPRTAPLFFALPAGEAPAAPLAVPLRLDPKTGALARTAAPLVRVFENPLRASLPVGDHLAEPIADAGPDHCLRETGPGAGARVVLDASRSRGSALRYAWRWPGGAAEGPRSEILLPPGLHDVRLEVTTAQGVTREDALVIEVAAWRARR
jgi:hypothetical protein